MSSLTVGALGTVATVAQLVGNINGLINKIKGAADTARQNVEECRLLAERVSEIKELLRHLEKEEYPAVELKQPLVRLGGTLEEAHGLVVSCSGWYKTSTAKKLFTARRQAEKFKRIHYKIDSRLSVFPVISHIIMIKRLDRILEIHLAESPSGSYSYDPRVDVAANPKILPIQLAESPSDSSSHDPHVDVAANPKMFTLAEIAEATQGFDPCTVLGQGFSGLVHKGCLQGGRDMAVKVLKNGQQGAEDTFVTEFEILSPLRHRNIISLLGWCSEEVHGPAQQPQRMLVYEYMPNGSLRDHLQLRSSTSPVTTSWMARIDALLGASRAIDHLHRHATPRVIHLDITSSNILLDAKWTPRLSGFGTSVLRACTDDDDDEDQLGNGGGQLVTEAMGTFGYVDPVYESTRMVSPAIDVYSFGVVMLEALTGKPPVDTSNYSADTLACSLPPIIEAAGGKLGNELLDQRPTPKPTPRQLEALQLVADTAVRCLWPSKNRPTIRQVITNLEEALSQLIIYAA